MNFNSAQIQQAREQMARVMQVQEQFNLPRSSLQEAWNIAVQDVARANNIDPVQAVASNQYKAPLPGGLDQFDYSTPSGAIAGQIAAGNYGLNQQQNFNRVDEFGPYGSATYTRNPDGSISRNYALSENQQQINDQTEQLDINLGDAANTALGQVGEAWRTPLNYDNLGSMPTLDYKGVPSANARNYSNAPGLIDANYNNAPLRANAPTSYSDAPQVRGIGDFDAERARIEDSLFNRYSGRINDDYNRELDAQKQYLADIGVSPGDDRYNDVLGELRSNRDDALLQAQGYAVEQGGNELGRNYGIESDARSKAVGETNTLYNLGADARTRGVAEENALMDNARLNRGQYTNEQNQLFSMESDARNNAINERNQLYSAGMNNRQQGINELNYLRKAPLEEFGALSSARRGVINPSFSGISQINVPTIDAAGIGYNYAGLNQAWDIAKMNDQTARYTIDSAPPPTDYMALENLRHQNAMAMAAQGFGYNMALQNAKPQPSTPEYNLGDAAVDIAGAGLGGFAQGFGSGLGNSWAKTKELPPQGKAMK